MVYIAVTERCQMNCEHCCMSAGPKGDDMTMEVFKQALSTCDEDTYLTIGGGEPTLHPQLMEMLGLAVLKMYNRPLIVTNGGITQVALELARAAKNGVIHAELSQDSYHAEIDQEVIDAFTSSSFVAHGRRRYPDGDLRGIRDVGEYICDVGRAWDWGPEHSCACTSTFIDPRGDVWACGCRLEKVGNVFDGYEIVDYDSECSRDQFELVEAEYIKLCKEGVPEEENQKILEDLFEEFNIIDRVDGWNRFQEMLRM